jgi:hypothetical protein
MLTQYKVNFYKKKYNILYFYFKKRKLAKIIFAKNKINWNNNK